MKHNEQCFKNQALRDLGVGGPLASCTCGLDALLRVARAASWFVEATPEEDLYYALNKYCVEAADAMKEALKEAEHLLD